MSNWLLPIFNDPKLVGLPRHLPLIGLLLLCGGGYWILAQAGYGNDAGTYALLHSFAQLFYGDYDPSRYSGALVAELFGGGAAWLGGYKLSNLVSVLLALGTLALFYRLLYHWLGRAQVAFLATVALAVNPWFVLVATTTTDYIYALFFGLLGWWLWRREWGPSAAVAFALAAGARLAYAPLAVLLLLWPLVRQSPRPWAEVAQNSLVFVIITALLYLPTLLAGGNLSALFFGAVPTHWDLTDYLARFVYKLVYLFGIPAAVVLVAWKFARLHLVLPVFLQRRDPVLWALYGLMLYHAVLFWLAPLETSYLLPLLLIVLAFVARVSKVGQWLLALIICFAAYNFVKTETLDIRYASTNPADPIEAVAATPTLQIKPGVLLEDKANRATQQQFFMERHQQRLENLKQQ